MSFNKDTAVAFLKSILRDHLPSNARRYQWKVVSMDFGVNLMGFPVDHSAFEGTFIEQDEQCMIIKTGRTEFAVLDKLLVVNPEQYVIGSKVKVTPYHRKEFYGRNLGDPVKSADGFSSTIQLGVQVTKLPFDKTGLICYQLNEMMQQVENLKMPDGKRTIVQALIDAGSNENNVTFVDPTDDNIIATPPSLKFGINVNGFEGFIQIDYMRASDTYEVYKVDQVGNKVETIENVYFDDLGEVIEALIGDDTWKLAKIDVLKAVKLKKAA